MVLGLFKTKERLEEVERSVAQSFSKVRQDTGNLYQWVQYLSRQNDHLTEQNRALKRLVEEQKFALNELKVTVQHLPRTPAEIKELVETHVNLDPMLDRIRRIEKKIELLEAHRQRPLATETPSVSAPQSTVKQAEPKAALREKLMRKIARNSKEYIKRLILGLVHKYGKVAAVQLREIVVEEQGLTSKSSFYRILKEMEDEGALEVVSQGKHTVYTAAPFTAQH